MTKVACAAAAAAMRRPTRRDALLLGIAEGGLDVAIKLVILASDKVMLLLPNLRVVCFKV